MKIRNISENEIKNLFSLYKAEDTNLKDIASKVNLHPRSLSKLFKNEYGEEYRKTSTSLL